MENDLLALNPLTKIRIYKEVERILFAAMDGKIVVPERAETIFHYVQETILDVFSNEEAYTYAQNISEKFSELKGLYAKFQSEQNEKVDHILALLVDSIMQKGDFDLASRVMDEVSDLQDKHGKTLEEIRAEFPGEFDSVVARMKNNPTST